jgi:hypothetical protein
LHGAARIVDFLTKPPHGQAGRFVKTDFGQAGLKPVLAKHGPVPALTGWD